MNTKLSLQTIEAELNQAEAARHAGKEGRARVCARRAAGWAVVVYRRRLGEEIEDENVLRNLAWLQNENTDDTIKQAANRLMTRVKPDHHLPHAEDPLDDASLIVAHFLGDS
jgi:hypothetical protein